MTSLALGLGLRFDTSNTRNHRLRFGLPGRIALEGQDCEQRLLCVLRPEVGLRVLLRDALLGLQLPLLLVLGSDQLRGSGLGQEGLDVRPILLDILLRRCLLVLGPLPQGQDPVDGGQAQTRHDARGDKPVHEHMGAQLNLNMVGCADLGNARTVTGTVLGLERAPAVAVARQWL